MALAVDVIHRRGPNNLLHHQLQPKKTKVRLYQLFILVLKWVCRMDGEAFKRKLIYDVAL